MATDWVAALPRPVAFVLSGGASLGAIQVGMLRALVEVGIEADLVVGTSVGTLNGAVLADRADSADAVAVLERTWGQLRRSDVLPGSLAAQAMSLLRTGTLHRQDGLRRVIARAVWADTFEQLARPLTVVTSEVLTSHVRWCRTGPLEPVLLAATAIPGLFPPVVVDGRYLADAGPVANVPLGAALAAGAASLVVLDAGDLCHLDAVPRGIPDGSLQAVVTAMRQRVLIEAPQVAVQRPLLYLPRPCVGGRSLLDFDRSRELIEPARALVAEFLRDAAVPRAGTMVGLPHHHPEEDDGHRVGHPAR